MKVGGNVGELWRTCERMTLKTDGCFGRKCGSLLCRDGISKLERSRVDSDLLEALRTAILPPTYKITGVALRRETYEFRSISNLHLVGGLLGRGVWFVFGHVQFAQRSVLKCLVLLRHEHLPRWQAVSEVWCK